MPPVHQSLTQQYTTGHQAPCWVRFGHCRMYIRTRKMLAMPLVRRDHSFVFHLSLRSSSLQLLEEVIRLTEFVRWHARIAFARLFPGVPWVGAKYADVGLHNRPLGYVQEPLCAASGCDGMTRCESRWCVCAFFCDDGKNIAETRVITSQSSFPTGISRLRMASATNGSPFSGKVGSHG